MKLNKNNRRQFLKNTSLASLGLGLIPAVGSCKTTKETGEKPSIACDKTTTDYYGVGPFYTANPPMIQNNMLAAANEPGQRLILSGQVRNLDCLEVIPDTVIDIWHANDAGDYDNSGYNLRGVTKSNSQGFYVFETILPGKYLNGSQYRPSHIHFKITPPSFPTLVTQLYFQGDTDIPGDASASITSGNYDATHRIIPLTVNSEGKNEGIWDIAINGDGVSVGVNDLHLDKGIIYDISPNPFEGSVQIKYGVFRSAKVSLTVYDLQGRLVANLEENKLSPEKYIATWEPDAGLPSGHYFVAMKVNDLQVHYMKLIKS